MKWYLLAISTLRGSDWWNFRILQVSQPSLAGGWYPSLTLMSGLHTHAHMGMHHMNTQRETTEINVERGHQSDCICLLDGYEEGAYSRTKWNLERPREPVKGVVWTWPLPKLLGRDCLAELCTQSQGCNLSCHPMFLVMPISLVNHAPAITLSPRPLSVSGPKNLTWL